MNNNATIEKMKQMRLYGMQGAFENAIATGKSTDFTADQLIGYLVESEWNNRTNRKTERLIKNARFRYQASIEEVKWDPARNIDKNLLLRLSDCSFIEKAEAIIITGSTGCGKSYLASALGYQACLKGYKVLYFNLGKLFSRLTMAKADGSYIKELSRIEKHDLLIIDDFGLQTIDSKKQMMLLDIFEDRHIKKSTIITSQIPVNIWHELLEEKTLADAILDRIVHNAYKLEIKGESMRKVLKIKEYIN